MSPAELRVLVGREAAGSQHLVAIALEIARTSPTFRRAVAAIEREKTKPSRCEWCREFTADGHTHDFLPPVGDAA